MAAKRNRTELLPGTLDMLILKVLEPGPMHGYAIARRIGNATDEVLLVEEGSLYPALHRLERRGHLRASWGTSESNRRAKFYEVTRDGRAQLTKQVSSFARLHEAIHKVLTGHPGEAPA